MAILRLSVPTVSCEHCVATIESSVSPLDGVSAVSVDLETKQVTVEGGDRKAVIAAIEKVGYPVA